MSRRKKGGHGGGGGGGGHGGGDARWMVTYADLLTLLMVLFLVLWVISTIDLKKFEKFKSGLGDFGNPAAEQNEPTAGEGLADGTGQDPTVVETTVAGEPSETTAPSGTGEGTGDGTGQVLDEQQLGGLVEGLQEAVDNAGLDSQITVSVDQRGLVITVSTDDVLFESGSADLGPDAKAVLAAVAPELGKLGNSIIVEGYTDKRPLRGRGDYDNWDLSVDRAVSVVKLLRDTFGFDPSRMAATGYGDQHPLAEGDDEASYAKNRRVQIVVVPSGPGPDGTTTTAESSG